MSSKSSKREFFAMLPSVDEVLANKSIIKLCEEFPRNIVLESIRKVIDSRRKSIVNLDERNIDKFNVSFEEIVENAIILSKKEYELSLKKVINATGIVVHTNLGRSLISESVKKDLWSAASRYSNLEYDIDEGKRGSRYTHLSNMIRRITGAEDVLVVNNNAAAVLLVLSTIAKGGEAIVSRGELVEVGGAFRIPSIMSLSGANLIEVGSTNKTHFFDYEDAITENTKILMKVHTSNYKIVGFSESVELDEMRFLGDKYSIPVYEDLGSGVFIDLSKYGMTYEPTVFDSIKKGVDIVSFSGDKMLGGPQAGIIVGKKEFIDKMKKNQLTRALRVDKMTIAALESSLRFYLDEEKAIKEIPTLRMLTYTKDELQEKAERLYSAINSKFNEKVDKFEIYIEDCKGQVGGGSMPTEELESVGVVIKPKKIGLNKFEELLRLGKYHIIARIYDEKYVLDVRTIFDEQFEEIASAIFEILS